ncbi:hypothetical protein [Burkholderia gladioli]|uniref:hypothetical protein n=1 Tax=Burkholderia gladioli TaxID=28095 RepID=UPI001641B3BF|nr:hypothetical protein [Burkholderia gladioli]
MGDTLRNLDCRTIENSNELPASVYGLPDQGGGISLAAAYDDTTTWQSIGLAGQTVGA